MEDRRTDQSGASKPDTTPEQRREPAGVRRCRTVLESEVPLSPAEQDEHRRRLEAARRPPAEALTPTQRWDRAPPAEATHPYLKAKGIRPHGTRREGDHLLIPIRRGTELIGLQAIAPDGTQRLPRRRRGRRRLLRDRQTQRGALHCPQLCGWCEHPRSDRPRRGHRIHCRQPRGGRPGTARNACRRSRWWSAPMPTRGRGEVQPGAGDGGGQGGRWRRGSARLRRRPTRRRYRLRRPARLRGDGRGGYRDHPRPGRAEVRRERRCLGQSRVRVAPVDRRIDAPPVALHLPVAYRPALRGRREADPLAVAGRFARGKVTLIAGDPGLGKSQVTAAWPRSSRPAANGRSIAAHARRATSSSSRPRTTPPTPLSTNAGRGRGPVPGLRPGCRA